MKYRITLTSKAIYEFDTSQFTAEQARTLAEEWFAERAPYVEFETLAPCEVDGKCPHADGNCSLCR